MNNPQQRHYTRWKILGTNPGGFNAYIAASYADEMRRIKNWIKARFAFMDLNLPGVCATEVSNFNIATNQIIVYPNPSVGEITIEVPEYLQTKDVSLNILSSQGIFVDYSLLFKSEKVFVINLDKLNSGLYIVELVTKSLKHREKFILMK